MNRKILFRGKLVNNGKWVYGGFWCNTSLVTTTIPHIIDSDGITHEVDPTTVGQYTGLTDTNGTLIFEGDVMEFDAYGLHFRGTVSFVDGNFRVMCNHTTASPSLNGAIKQHDATCVGNIQDKPKSLSENKMNGLRECRFAEESVLA